MQKILGKVRKAIVDYHMIDDGDKIVVGVSGGKDSLLLLTALAMYQNFSPQKFELYAVTIDLGFADTDEKEKQAMTEYIEKLGIKHITEHTKIGNIIFEDRKEKSPCSLCSKMRRGALNTKAIELGAKKLALGHHSDDALQTLLLSFIYEGRLSTFQPTGFMDRTGITLMRPFIYVSEKEIEWTANRLKLPIVHNYCPANKNTQREYMSELVKKLEQDIPGATDRMTAAVMHPERNNLWKKD